MDEIDWIKNTRKAIVVMAKGISIFIGIFVLLQLVLMLRDGITDYNVMVITVLIGIGVSIILFIVLAFAILYIIYKIVYGGQKQIILDKEYIREICKEYTPAIVSLVYDLKVEVYKDYTATMLELYNKGYLNIFDNNKISKIEINKEKDFSSLKEHEKYLIDCINNEKEFDENIFKEVLIREAQSSGLLTNKKESKIFKILKLVLIFLSIVIVSYLINKILFYVVFTTIALALAVYIGLIETIVDTFYKRTQKR